MIEQKRGRERMTTMTGKKVRREEIDRECNGRGQRDGRVYERPTDQ